MTLHSITRAAQALTKPETKVAVLLAVVAFHGPLLLVLSFRGRRSGRPALRFLLWALSAVYFPLMTYVLSVLTTYISNGLSEATGALMLVVLVQCLRAKADLAALAVAAVASPACAGDELNSLKIRRSTESFINTFWVAGLVVYNIFRQNGDLKLTTVLIQLLISPLWALVPHGACRTVLRFAAFQRATGSFALGRNVELVDGYMLQLRQGGSCFETAAVPRLIVTGESNRDVEEGPAGYHVKRSSLEFDGDKRKSRLVTLDKVWSESLLPAEHKDLCLSFSLFKCLRRRFAGYRLAAEAGSSWAFRFVHDGLLGPQDDHERIFRVIAGELSFASDFFYSPLPVASLGTTAAALQFLLSVLTFPLLSILALILVLLAIIDPISNTLAWLALVLAALNASTEIVEMVASVRSKWTKISIIGHYVRCRHSCARRVILCLLKRKRPKFWKDKIRQTELLNPDLFGVRRPCARFFIRLCVWYLANIKIRPAVKRAILRSFRASGGQLSDGAAAVRRRRQAFRHDNDISWACRDRDGGELATTTDAILVWHIATSLFSIRYFSSTPPAADTGSSKAVARCLSRYCMYLLAEAPDLLPDNSAWTKRRYEAVKKDIEEVSRRSGAVQIPGVYEYLVDSFSGEHTPQYHEVLNKGSKLGKQLVEEAGRRPEEGETGDSTGGEGAVWELLSEFWSEMLLYLAPSDNVKGHIEALQRGGELITLLWALLQHAGITSRPPEFDATACVLVSTGDPDCFPTPE